MVGNAHPTRLQKRKAMRNLDKYKQDLDVLIALGDKMILDLASQNLADQGQLNKKQETSRQEIKGAFESEYQRWYTESSIVIKQLIPDRIAEFEHLYKGEGRRKTINSITYSVQDWLNGVRSGTTAFGKKSFDDFNITIMKFNTQLAILKSVESRFVSTLFDIRQLVQADLFDSELDSASELLKHKFLRGAGAIAGVVLEKHLAQVILNHNITTRKKSPTINDFNELLKKGRVLDTPSWRQIQRLGDIRNLCDHNKEREPTNDEVQELIDGTKKFTKILF